MSRLPPEFNTLEGKVLSSRVYPEFFPLSATDHILNVGCGEGPQMVAYGGPFARMVGLDINAGRLDRMRALASALNIANVETLAGNVESIPLPDASFDVVLAIDIIEHVEHPERLLAEIHRLLKPGGRLLITFPAMHDRFVDALSFIKRLFTGKKRAVRSEWHPDDHQHEFTVGQWKKMTLDAGLVWQRSRATTLFPPLHLYGIPRFWFSWEWLHRADRWLCARPSLQNAGQTVMMELRKV